MNESIEILKILADGTRVKIINLLMQEDSYVEKLAAQLAITPATVCYHLKKMETHGLVKCSRTQFYIIYSLNQELFDRPLKAFIQMPLPKEDSEDKYVNNILSAFFRGGRLQELPVQRKKREIVLRKIAADFETDRRYTEIEVNDIIHRYYEDHCLIRREMIAYGIMERDHGVYWLKN